MWYYALISTQDVVFICPFALPVGAADHYRCRGYGLVCAACERRSLLSQRLGRLHGARLHHLCRGLVTVVRGLCRALEAEEEEARRFRAAPMRYGPIDRREWAAAAAATAACVAAVLLLLLLLL